MYGDVAPNAFAAGLEAQAAMRNLRGVKFRMAFQAKLAPLAPHQQHPVVAPMRIVASGAAFHLHRRMLVDKRSTLLHVALHAGFRACAYQAGCIYASVRIVAVRTLHQAFRNAVVFRQGKLCLNRLVAPEAKCRLRLLQQAVMQPASLVGQLRQLKEIRLRVLQIALAQIFNFVHKVRGMALIAGNAVARMFGVFEKLLLLAADVAGEAARGIFRRRALEGE